MARGSSSGSNESRGMGVGSCGLDGHRIDSGSAAPAEGWLGSGVGGIRSGTPGGSSIHQGGPAGASSIRGGASRASSASGALASRSGGASSGGAGTGASRSDGGCAAAREAPSARSSQRATPIDGLSNVWGAGINGSPPRAGVAGVSCSTSDSSGSSGVSVSTGSSSGPVWNVPAPTARSNGDKSVARVSAIGSCGCSISTTSSSVVASTPAQRTSSVGSLPPTARARAGNVKRTSTRGPASTLQARASRPASSRTETQRMSIGSPFSSTRASMSPTHPKPTSPPALAIASEPGAWLSSRFHSAAWENRRPSRAWCRSAGIGLRTGSSKAPPRAASMMSLSQPAVSSAVKSSGRPRTRSSRPGTDA